MSQVVMLYTRHRPLVILTLHVLWMLARCSSNDRKVTASHPARLMRCTMCSTSWLDPTELLCTADLRSEVHQYTARRAADRAWHDASCRARWWQMHGWSSSLTTPLPCALQPYRSWRHPGRTFRTSAKSHSQLAMANQLNKTRLDELFSGYQASFPEVAKQFFSARFRIVPHAALQPASLYQVPSITATQLHDLLQGPSGRDVIMVDTRTDEERAVSRIPGTVLSKEQFEGQKANFRNKTVVAYCTGMCPRHSAHQTWVHTR